MPETLLIEAKQLTRSYREAGGERRVLAGVDLRLAPGECLALLGRSGSGKSTLLNLLGGIDLPSSGELVVAGQDLVGLSERERTLFRRRHIGFIYQFFNLIPTLTAAENVALPLELNGVPERAMRERVQQMLAEVGLADRQDDFPDRLSGGEQQRVAIARALVHQPGLVLADEPTGNLDAETGRHVLAMLTGMASRHGRGLILVTHSMEVARSADRTLTLHDGHLRVTGGDIAW